MGWYSLSWTNRIKVTVLNTKVDADITGFKIYVDLSNLPAVFHTNVNQTDARDIRVTTSDGVTEVPREVVYYDSTNDKGEIHLKGNILNATDVDFYIYFGNPNASDYAVTDTYGARNVWSDVYTGVWHLNQDPSGSSPQETNSVSASYNGASSGAMTSGDLIDEKVGKGMDLDGSDDRIDVTSASALNAYPLTISCWVKTTWNGNNSPGVINKYLAASANGYSMMFNQIHLGHLYAWYWKDGSNFVYDSTGEGAGLDFGVINDGNWKHVAFRVDANGGKTFLNGAGVTTLAWTGTAGATTTTEDLHFGYYNNSFTKNLPGQIDEVRLTASSLTDQWISTEYNNQNSPSTFYSLGTVEYSPHVGSLLSMFQ